jgi:uncharacterized membrane protein
MKSGLVLVMMGMGRVIVMIVMIVIVMIVIVVMMIVMRSLPRCQLRVNR